MSLEHCNLRLDGNQAEFLRYGVSATVPSMRGSNTPDGILPAFMSVPLDIGPGQSAQPQHKYAWWRLGEDSGKLHLIK